MQHTTDHEFKVTLDQGVARIDLNRPEEGNALTRSMMRKLAESLRRSADDEQTRVVVIEAQGRHFCRGRDGKGESRVGMTPYEIRVQQMGAVLDVYRAVADAAVPVVALVQGDAIGFGAALAVSCDITLAADHASFAFPEIEHDIPPTMAMCAALGKVPAKALSYLIYSAESVTASQAVGLGLASKILPSHSFAPDSAAFVAQLANRPRLVLETIKRYQSKAAQLTPDMASEYAGTLLALVRS